MDTSKQAVFEDVRPAAAGQDLFTTSLQHILAELERLDQLIRAQVSRARALQKVEHEFQGLCISDEEVDALLDGNLGEDSSFILGDRATHTVIHPDNSFYVALIHPGNTNPRRTGGERWSACDRGAVRDIMGSDWPYYQGRAAVAAT
jgi:hypothetical protein